MGLAIILTGCTKKDEKTSQEDQTIIPPKQEVEEKIESNINADKEDEEQEEVKNVNEKDNFIAYKDATYGFSLEFPQSWERYVTAKRELDWGDSGVSDSIDFGLPAQKEIFNISIHTKEQWEEITKTGGPHPIYLAENDQYVFGWASAQDVVNEEIGERFDEVPTIIDTFEL